ncbi:MAG: C40 family peptidase [Acidobacteria bacterium]|nr:C40 family peptidase [Acidobacteriota bacterium]
MSCRGCWPLVLFLAFLSLPFSAAGQCRPGDVLIGEDDRYYYCSSPASKAQVQEAVQKAKDELLGEEWRFRKAVLDFAGCLAGTPALFGGKIRFPQECTGRSELAVDCSGYTAHAARFAACFVDGFHRAAYYTFAGLDTDAAGQARYFQEHGSLLSSTATPTPGDFIFFEGTYDKNRDGVVNRKDGITHVAIFVGTDRDGRTVILHASSGAKPPRVLFGDLAPEMKQRIVGYGNASKLYRSIQGR